MSPWSSSSRPLDSLKNRFRESLREDPQNCAESALCYAKDLEQAFVAVKRITDAYRTDSNGEILSKLFMLERMGNISPLLIAVWLKFGDDEKRIKRVLGLLEAFIVRVYLMGGYRSNTGASTFGSMAHRVHNERLDYDGLIEALKEITLYYQDDTQFEQSLRREGFYNRLGSRSIKYILTQYEIYLRAKSDVSLALSTQEDILTSDYEVEHIWPQHPAEEMSEEEALEHRRSVHGIGNLTIASKSWNGSMGNKPFVEKRFQPQDRPSYANSILRVQKDLAKQCKWNSGTIGEREDRLVQFALQRWSV